MAYLMVKYQGPSTYALMDLSTEEFEAIGAALRNLEEFYSGLGASEESLATVRALHTVLERRWDDD